MECVAFQITKHDSHHYSFRKEKICVGARGKSNDFTLYLGTMPLMKAFVVQGRSDVEVGLEA